jgi:eukaryotic-like serine/threonine-protein kinase
MRELSPGSRLSDDYEIIRELGRGGMGLVYLAEDLLKNSQCALKTYLGDEIANREGRDNFWREALLWVNLERHAHILTARSVREYDGQIFVEMDYIAPDEQGCVTISDYLDLECSPWDESDIVRLAVQFCYGMQHASRNGMLVHRDIKPENILIEQGDRLKIADFGIAIPSRYAIDTATGSSNIEAGVFRFTRGNNITPIAGTPGYMAPEVLSGQEPDTRSDIYNFGLVLAQITLHSRLPPFFGDAIQKDNFLQAMIESQRLTRLHLPSKTYTHVIEKCLAFNPADRYANFFDLGEELRTIFRKAFSRDLLIRGPNSDDLEYLSAKATNLGHLGKTSEAITLFSKVLEKDPDCLSALNNLGGLLGEQEKYRDALPYLVKATRIDPQNATSHSNLGNVLNQLDRKKESLKCYEYALSIHPDHFRALFGKSGVEFDLGKLDDAAHSISRALAIYPNSVDGVRNKAIIERARGNYELSLEAWETIYRLDSSSIRPIAESVIDLVRMGRKKEADRIFFDQLLPHVAKGRERGNATKLYFDQAFEAYSKGLDEYAVDMYSRVLNIDPDDKEARYNRGVTYLREERHEDALNDLSASVDSSSSEQTELYNLGVAYYANNKLEKASRALKSALAIDERYENALYLFAITHYQLNDLATAASAGRRFLRLPNPSEDSVLTIRRLLADIQAPD